MSHHIIHILHHGSRLTKRRGMMVCRTDDDGDEERELAIEDVRAVIVAARGVFMSGELISALMESGAVILHCDTSYRPVAVTSGLDRVVTGFAAFNQANRTLKLHERLWRLILAAKVANQARVLEKNGRNHAFIRHDLKGGEINEAACARHYWMEFFAIFGLEGVIRRGEDEAGINAKLNYGYAVLGALVHRSIVAHGLSPLFGMHHVTRYKAHAMVYDLIEPWRPFVDDMLVEFEKNGDEEPAPMEKWARHVATDLRDQKIKTKQHRLKLLDALDVYVSGIAKCYEHKTIRHAWMPDL